MALVEQHRLRGDSVLVLANPASTRIGRLRERHQDHPHVRIRSAALHEYGSLTVDEPFDVFYHLAWTGGQCRDDWEVNLHSALATRSAVELAHRLGCRAFIGAGSQAECGPQQAPLSDRTWCTPVNPFGVAKLSALFIARQRAHELGLRFNWARILSVYGPYDGEGTLVVSTIRRILRGEPLAFTAGSQTWDFLYADDAARAMQLVADRGKPDAIYTIGSGQPTPLRDFIRALTAKFGVSADPYLGHQRIPSGSPTYLVADITRLREEFGWEPVVDVEEGLDRTIQYCVASEGRGPSPGLHPPSGVPLSRMPQ
jgi:nucleoside-diphosphate-sugar epimerase